MSGSLFTLAMARLVLKMLGGPGMNAKLNLALREHNGLVYTVLNVEC